MHAGGVAVAKQIIRAVLEMHSAHQRCWAAAAPTLARPSATEPAAPADGAAAAGKAAASTALVVRSRSHIESVGVGSFGVLDFARQLVQGSSPFRVLPAGLCKVDGMHAALATQMNPSMLAARPHVSVEIVDEQLQVAAKEAATGSTVIEIPDGGAVPQPSAVLGAALQRHSPGDLASLVKFERVKAVRQAAKRGVSPPAQKKEPPACVDVASRTYTLRWTVSQSAAEAIALRFSKQCGVPGRAVWVAIQRCDDDKDEARGSTSGGTSAAQLGGTAKSAKSGNAGMAVQSDSDEDVVDWLMSGRGAGAGGPLGAMVVGRGVRISGASAGTGLASPGEFPPSVGLGSTASTSIGFGSTRGSVPTTGPRPIGEPEGVTSDA